MFPNQRGPTRSFVTRERDTDKIPPGPAKGGIYFPSDKAKHSVEMNESCQQITVDPVLTQSLEGLPTNDFGFDIRRMRSRGKLANV